jgi:hypothetical protein
MNTKRLIVLAPRIPVHTSDLDSHTGAKQDVESRANGLALRVSDRLGEVPPIPSGRDRYSGHGQELRQT